jgi:hypothetical protein
MLVAAAGAQVAGVLGVARVGVGAQPQWQLRRLEFAGILQRTACKLTGNDLPAGASWGSVRPVQSRGEPMNIVLSAGPLVSLIAGILILIVPRLLNYIVALYLIVIGLLGLFAAKSSHIV